MSYEEVKMRFSDETANHQMTVLQNCHIGMMDVDGCRAVIAAVMSLKRKKGNKP